MILGNGNDGLGTNIYVPVWPEEVPDAELAASLAATKAKSWAANEEVIEPGWRAFEGSAWRPPTKHHGLPDEAHDLPQTPLVSLLAPPTPTARSNAPPRASPG